MAVFLAACAFALGSVLQQKGDVETTAGGQDRRFLRAELDKLAAQALHVASR
jgi:hypothetical protein